jgi:osmotically-inducible protein OsmY
MAVQAHSVEEAIRTSLASEPRLDVHRYPLAVSFEDDTATLEGEVGSVAMKKLVLERAAAVSGVRGIVDRVRVAPAERQGDKEIADHVRDALLQEPALATCRLRRIVGGREEVVLAPDAPRGDICIRVADGVVTLDGEAPSLSHKRLAGVLAWWVPGSRDVVNGLAVEPEEADSDAEITDAVRLVLEKDPFVDAGQVLVGTHDRVVTLRGLVPTESEREMAEADAWYVFGVDGVVNELEVRR